MGYYIQTGGNVGKAKFLIKNEGASRTSLPTNFESVPEDKSLICVIDNIIFEAAGLVYDANEFNAFSYDDGRPKEWLLMPKNRAYELSGFLNKAP